jgi:hypothetical protein
MGLLENAAKLVRGLFGIETEAPQPPPRLDATTEDALGNSLQALLPGERGWIPFSDYIRLFATSDAEIGPSEWDEAALAALGEVAASHKCSPRTERNEQRIYFTKLTN